MPKHCLFTKNRCPPRGHSDSRSLSVCKNIFSHLFTFALCCFSWVFFRAGSISDALYILRHSITGGKAPLQYCKNALLTLFPGEILSAILLFALLLLFTFDFINEKRDPIVLLSYLPTFPRWCIYLGFLTLLLLLIPKESAAVFIYFQF